LAAKLLFLLASIAMQNVAVGGIRNGLLKDGDRCAILPQFALLLSSSQIPVFWVTIWQPNSFTNPPNFALPSFLNILILPRFAFVLGRIALILQNPLFFTSFFRIFAAEIRILILILHYLC
jgi:hypothetical protein